jgi:hypothetical protein
MAVTVVCGSRRLARWNAMRIDGNPIVWTPQMMHKQRQFITKNSCFTTKAQVHWVTTWKHKAESIYCYFSLRCFEKNKK